MESLSLCRPCLAAEKNLMPLVIIFSFLWMYTSFALDQTFWSVPSISSSTIQVMPHTTYKNYFLSLCCFPFLEERNTVLLCHTQDDVNGTCLLDNSWNKIHSKLKYRQTKKENRLCLPVLNTKIETDFTSSLWNVVLISINRSGRFAF